MQKASGLLCHITSLSSPFGVGDFGPVAYQFIDQLKDSHQSFWQMLPIGNTGDGGCPYSTDSAFGSAEYYISPELVVQDFHLEPSLLSEINDENLLNNNRVDFALVRAKKMFIVQKAYEKMRSSFFQTPAYLTFAQEEKYWLNDYADFRALKDKRGGRFTDWNEDLSFEEKELSRFYQFVQYVALTQLKKLKTYAEKNNIKLVGDLPIFVSYNSMDVWKHPEDFYLGPYNELIYETGAAPDAFSENGQKWGTPIYNWDQQQKSHFHWWQERLAFLARYFHVVRIDHFRGFCATWISKVSDENAKDGQWYNGPGRALFDSLKNQPQLFAEDLGYITEDVIRLRDDLHLPSMKVMQFMSAGLDNPHHPHYYKDFCVLYSGTHDNSTLMGWWKGLSTEVQRDFSSILGLEKMVEDIDHWQLLQCLFSSQAPIVITPVQDLLGLGDEARFNIPGTVLEENWTWKLSSVQRKALDWSRLKQLTFLSQRNIS
jgi:4-alpha-glucanotransferase